MQKLFLFLLLSTFIAQGQKTFTNSIHGDLTFNQIQGDGYVGYNHIGFQVGFGTMFKVAENHRLGFEINYAQRGSRQRINLKKFVTNDFKLYLNYVDVPVFYIFPKWGINFEVGPVFSYLIDDTYTTNGIENNLANAYNEVELGLLLSANFKISEKLYFKIRANNSITGIFKTPETSTGYFWQSGAFHRGLGVNLSYYFSKPNIGDSGTLEL
tara:strand:+ start:2224 stop:2859 length:636 start_codon:yes stop_codon:yes gene_type:complete